MATNNSGSPRIVVIGAGIGGLSFVIALQKRFPGFNNLTVYEKASDVGGTWRSNIYPGCSSDVGMHLYSLSTDLYPDWHYTHGYQPEIQSYWQDLSHKYNLYPHLVFNTLVVSAEWDNQEEAYHIVTEDAVTGARSTSSAKILISALGVLDVPRYPKISGLDTFKGEQFHSARWNYNIDLRNKRVAVIGNGASATQFVPIISSDPTVDVTNFCRTPNWLNPPIRSEYSRLRRFMFKYLPLYMRMVRFLLFLRGDMLYWVVFGTRFLHSAIKKARIEYIRQKAPKEYRDQLIPSYKLGCKRLIFDTDYLAALHRPNLSLNWDGIESVFEGGIVTKKGEKLPFDVLIFSTGFVADDYPLHVRGLSQTVKEYYESAGGPKAYVGTTVPGFPNLFMIAGPNTATGHLSVIFTEEVQINYILQLLKPILEGHVSSINVTDEATDAYNEKIHARLAKSVFVDCVSWYRKGSDGKVTSIFPGSGFLFWWWLRKVDWSHYKVTALGSWYHRPRRMWLVPVSTGILLLSVATRFGGLAQSKWLLARVGVVQRMAQKLARISW
ncbi:FAD/NAD-P-binding domain-containing protein [Desarmillaria tabescens]|uniref:L-ornithine N(5)-monooxygenase [NAD(P)H] n=1 Tax=Armillaria tabescens TaxID=1929756 RepID=A0AA39K658_ARMTA|nr:FAD/NAD-P-binding domain-containing protein [Desarmillaria tabescens]KAK0455286.1 FAD/NAD-P-binding domain-containing protein [Desarmillaria tabescens]